ncbi:MAG: 4Fe-4S dicluster domain-containing protein [Thermoplasmatota archaeon]
MRAPLPVGDGGAAGSIGLEGGRKPGPEGPGGGPAGLNSGSLETVDESELDPGFAEEVAREHGGENIRRCFHCGTCVAICPVGEVDARYDPRRIIRMVNLGMRRRVLESPAIWLCSGCYNCSERCPQDVKPTLIMQALQHIAVREGLAHRAFRGAVGLLCRRGRLIEVSEFDNRQRRKLSLPEIKEEAEPTRAILVSRGLDGLAEEGRGAGEPAEGPGGTGAVATPGSGASGGGERTGGPGAGARGGGA